MSQYVITDIHGCCKTFRRLLFDHVKLSRNDTLFLLGDYIDRGPDSKGVIETILELQSTGYKVRALLGNHEIMLLEVNKGLGLKFWLYFGGKEMLKSYAIKHPWDIPAEHLDFVKNLPLFFETDTHIFIHASLDFSHNDPLKETDKNYMLWERKPPVVEPDKIGGRRLVTGHNICTLDQIRRSLETDHIQLDNGCFYGKRHAGKGNLVALEIETGKLLIQENID